MLSSTRTTVWYTFTHLVAPKLLIKILLLQTVPHRDTLVPELQVDYIYLSDQVSY